MFQSDPLWKLWCLLLIRATHKERQVPVRTGRGETIITLQPGQVLFGRNSFAKALRCNPNAIPQRINKLCRLGNCNIQPHTHFSIVTINNWDTYAALLNSSQQAKHQPNTNQTPTKQHIQELKHLSIKEKVQTPSAAEIAASQIVAYYEKEIREERSSRYRARKNVQALLKNGCTKEVLWECVNLYASDADHKDPQFRKVAGNFFGRDAVYKNYEDDAKRIVEVEYAAKG